MASMSTAARSGPVSCFCPFATSGCRVAREATRSSTSCVTFLAAAMMSRRSQMIDSGGVFVQPGTDDGCGLVGVLVSQFADLLYRLCVHLALDLRNVDHGGGAARCRRLQRN